MQLHPRDYLPGEEGAKRRRVAYEARERDQLITDGLLKTWKEAIEVGCGQGQEEDALGVESTRAEVGASSSPRALAEGEAFEQRGELLTWLRHEAARQRRSDGGGRREVRAAAGGGTMGEGGGEGEARRGVGGGAEKSGEVAPLALEEIGVRGEHEKSTPQASKGASTKQWKQGREGLLERLRKEVERQALQRREGTI